MRIRDWSSDVCSSDLGKPGRRLEVEQPQRLAELVVLLGREIELARLEIPAQADVGGLVGAVGHLGQRGVGNPAQPVLQLGGEPPFLLLGCRHLVLEAGHLGHQRRGVVALALGLADRLGGIVAPGLQGLQRRLDLAAPGVEGENVGRQGREAAALQRGRSEEHTSELQSLMSTSYAVFCLKKKNTHKEKKDNQQTKNRHLSTKEDKSHTSKDYTHITQYMDCMNKTEVKDTPK